MAGYIQILHYSIGKGVNILGATPWEVKTPAGVHSKLLAGSKNKRHYF